MQITNFDSFWFKAGGLALVFVFIVFASLPGPTSAMMSGGLAEAMMGGGGMGGGMGGGTGGSGGQGPAGSGGMHGPGQGDSQLRRGTNDRAYPGRTANTQTQRLMAELAEKRARLEAVLDAERPDMDRARVLLREIQTLKIRLQEAGNGRGRN